MLIFENLEKKEKCKTEWYRLFGQFLWKSLSDSPAKQKKDYGGSQVPLKQFWKNKLLPRNQIRFFINHYENARNQYTKSMCIELFI